MEIEFLKLEFYLGTRVLDTRDASFQNCFETWQLTKFFNIYCYLEKKFKNVEHVTLLIFKFWEFGGGVMEFFF